jgi:hypothetical protein
MIDRISQLAALLFSIIVDNCHTFLPNGYGTCKIFLTVANLSDSSTPKHGLNDQTLDDICSHVSLIQADEALFSINVAAKNLKKMEQ